VVALAERSGGHCERSKRSGGGVGKAAGAVWWLWRGRDGRDVAAAPRDEEEGMWSALFQQQMRPACNGV
jgi:hypothetical protein